MSCRSKGVRSFLAMVKNNTRGMSAYYDNMMKRKRTTENGRGLALKTKPKPKTLKPSPLTVKSREGILTRAFGPW